ncbi:MAG: hypothetical protein K2K44_03050 [Oscillospiraceae bacterium]|nr:hypothetical protein [Oscillospiraceae bacterium]
MRKKVKGVAVIAVVLIAAATFAVGVGVGMWISGRDGGFGGEAVQADVSVSEEITETEAETFTTTEMVTTVMTAEYIEVVIDGDKYLYNGVFMKLDDFISEITKNGQNLRVSISFTDIATQYAYEELVKKLDENGIEYMENN